MDKIKIISQCYSIDFVENVDVHEKLLGKVDHVLNAIRVSSLLTDEKKKVVLLHEIIHVIFEQLGFFEEHDNEQLICSLSSSLVQVLNDNKSLLAFLTS